MAVIHVINATVVNNGSVVTSMGGINFVTAGKTDANSVDDVIYRGRVLALTTTQATGNFGKYDIRFKPQYLMDVGSAD